jgi:hypothetical protein
MKLKMPRMGGLPMPEASLPKVPGAPASPKVSSPMKVGEQATVKTPKSKKLPDATAKPSVFFKAEDTPKTASVQNLKAFLDKKTQKRQSSQSNERLSMDHDKKISAREAAMAVLKKAHELLNASKLAKSLPAQAAPVAKADVTPADGVQAQGAPAENYNGNPAPGATPKNLGENYKGHLKLAKWVGRMEQKRAAKKAAPAPAAAEAEASTEKPKAE